MRGHRVFGVLAVFALVTAPLASKLNGTARADADGPTTGTVETDRGLHTASFDTLYGTVTVSLPDDLSAGDSISGTVETKPAGKQNEDVARNQDELSGVVIEIAESRTPAKNETAQVQVPDNAPARIPVVVRDRGGKEIARALIPVKPKAPTRECGQPAGEPVLVSAGPKTGSAAEGARPAESSGPNTIRGSLTHATVVPPGSPNPCPVEVPTFTQPGRTLEIRGPFDGKSGTTTVNVGGQPTKVLAESPRKAVVKTPPNFSGSTEIEVFKKGRLLARAPVRSVGVKLWAGKLNLVRGETTKFTATVQGLEGLDVPVSLRIENKSPAVVSMEGGNLQTFAIAPNQVDKGQFVIGRVLTGIQPGGFGIVAVVDAKLRSIPPGGLARPQPQPGAPPELNRPGNVPGTQRQGGQQPPPAQPVSAPRVPDGVRQTARIPPPVPCTGTFDDFESGVLAWDASGTFLEHQPVTGDVNVADVRPPGFRPEVLRTIGGDYWDTPFPNGHQGEHWIWSKFSGEAATGGILSPEFTVATRYVHFLVAGGDDPGVSASVQVESLPGDEFVGEHESAPRQSPLPGDLPPRSGSPSGTAGTGQPETTWRTLGTARGRGTDMMRRVVFEIPSRYMGRRARFRVDDRSATAHIAVDDFQCSNERPQLGAGATPVWGIADTHIHQFTNIGFGGQFIRGYTFDHSESRPCDSTNPADLVETADCAMAKALKRCDASPNNDLGLGHGMGGVNDHLGEGYHGTMGYPKFDGWPKWSSLDHQRVYSDWLKRAHQAGLQLIVIQLTSNEPICDTAAHDYPTCRDMYNVDLQIAEAQAFERHIAAHDGGWYKIVRTPQEAREAIAQGKLAAVLGIEVDTLFDCPALGSSGGTQPNTGFEPNQAAAALGLPARGRCTPEQVTERLQHYVNQGVRHFYPIHIMDNQFGGAAIYNEFFQVANHTVSGSYFHLEPDPRRCAIDVAYSFRMRNIPAAEATALWAFGDYSFDLNSTPNGRHCNAIGLTPLGEHLVREMMRLKVFIDVDHMSEKAFQRTVEIANEPGGPYPLLSGHAGFRELGYSIDEAVAQLDNRADAAGMVRHESMKSASMVEAIWNTGGIVAPIIEPGNNKRFDSPSNLVVNDCPGSSKSWAQNYLYAADRMHGRGLGWGSEMMGVTKLPNPRFGPDACKAVEQSDAHLLGFGAWGGMLSRTALAARQATPADRGPGTEPGPIRVSYRPPQVGACSGVGSFFPDDHPGTIEKGLCMAHLVTGSSWEDIDRQCLAQAPPCALVQPPVAADACHLSNNVCRGVRRGMDARIDCDDRVWETGAGSRNRTGACRAQQGLPCNTGNGDVDSVCRDVSAGLQGQRQPTALEPVVAGAKVFNINTDGFANVGMVPDFLADLETVGVTKPQFEPLFRSAEDFIEAWEKIDGTRPRGAWN